MKGILFAEDEDALVVDELRAFAELIDGTDVFGYLFASSGDSGLP